MNKFLNLKVAKASLHNIRVLRGENGSTELHTYLRKIVFVDMPLQRNKTMFEPLQNEV